MKRQNRVAFFNILSTLLLQGMSIITMPLFTRLLGDSGYGMTRIYNIWTSVLAIVFTVQTYNTLVNARMEYPLEEQRQYQSSVMALSVLVFAACSAIVLCFLGPIAKALKLDRLLVVFMLAQAFGTFCVNFLNTKFIYEFKAGWNMLLSLAVNVVTLVLSVVLVLALPEHVNYYGRIAAVAGTYTLLGIPICLTILAQGRTFYRRDYWKFCFILAVPAIFHNLSDLILGQIDSIMIQQMMGTAELGIYGAAASFGGIMFTIFHALNNSWVPFFFEDFKNGDLDGVKRKAANFQELFTVLALGFILLTREVYRIFVQGSFWKGTALVPLFVSGYYLNFLCTYPVNYEYYHKKNKAAAAVTISASACNTVLNYVLIGGIGMAGAAIATLISRVIQLAMHDVYCRFVLKKGDYPFPLRQWAGPAVLYFAGVALVYLTEELWPLRWILGAALGVWELLRIRRRKVLI